MSLRARVVLLAALAGGSATVAGAQAQSPDSVLTAACAGGAGMADGLLFVEFRADVEQARRASMVKEAGATLASGPYNEAYVVLPPGSRTDLAADRLIRLDGVMSVGDVTCPAPAAPPAAATGADSTRPDTTARPDSAARPPAADTARAPASPADTARRTAPSDSMTGTAPATVPGAPAPADSSARPTPGDGIAPSPGPT